MKRLSAESSDILLGDDLRGLAEPGLGAAMQLLPGVAVTNDGGEGRQVSVRGVGSEFTRVRINGMETLATFGGTNAGGGTNRGRAFDFNVFAADLFDEIRVRKTPSADVDEGSLGATVDLQTRSPLEGPRSRLQLTLEGGYNFGATRRPRACRPSPRAAAGTTGSVSWSRPPMASGRSRTSAPTPDSGRPATRSLQASEAPRPARRIWPR
jgi:TonB-dependent receptor